MNPTEWTNLAAALAWPIVAFMGLIYVWRSDAIGQLIKISDSVKDLNAKLSELVSAEQSLKQSADSMLGITTTISQVQNEIISIKSDIENIVDNVETRFESLGDKEQKEHINAPAVNYLFSSMEQEWQVLISALQDRFGSFDGRSVAASVRAFTHENRKGDKLTDDQAEEIGRLHSSIKSYRRRQYNIDEWLKSDTSDNFVNACKKIKLEIFGN
jgi:septal ring factor EnvC (AmiA/AmiB activator)